MKTALAEAFAQAGIQSSEEWLDEIAQQAWNKWSSQDAAGARRDYVISKLKPENPTLWALIERWQPSVLIHAVGWLLNNKRLAIEEAQPQRNAASAAGGGQEFPDTQVIPAPATNAAHGQRSEPSTHLPEPKGSVPAAPPTDRHAETIQHKLATMRTLSRLDTVSIDGQPVRRVRVGEARAWAEKHQVRARWLQLVTANMPDHWVIGEHMTPEIADELYQRAEAELANA